MTELREDVAIALDNGACLLCGFDVQYDTQGDAPALSRETVRVYAKAPDGRLFRLPTD